MEQLALKFRPRRFEDLVGQGQVQVILRQMVATRRVRTALLFDGPRGTGKTTTARILAAALNCRETPVPCGHCVSCKSVFDGTSPDLIEIDAASNGLVDDIRQLRQQVLYATAGDWRIVVLDEAHSMSRAAFNASLKVIEEPPPGTVFVFVTTEPGKIPDTVVSRCSSFTFKRIGAADIVDRLTHICDVEGFTVEPQLLSLIGERADGGMRDAVMSLDQITAAGIFTLDAYVALTGETDYAPALIQALAVGDIPAAYAGLHRQLTRTGDARTIADDLTATLRDILVLGTGGTITKQGEALAARQALAERIQTAHAFAAMKVLWDLTTKVSHADARNGLDLAVVMLTEVFGQAPKPANPPPGAAPRKLSLAEMAR